MVFIKRVLVFTIVVLAAHGAALQAQVGKGLIDPNVASEQQLAGLPNMTPALAKAPSPVCRAPRRARGHRSPRAERSFDPGPRVCGS